MSVEDSSRWDRLFEEEDSRMPPSSASDRLLQMAQSLGQGRPSGRLSRLEEAGGMSEKPVETMVASGRFAVTDLVSSSSDDKADTGVHDEEAAPQEEPEDKDSGHSSDVALLDWGETEQLEWWQQSVEPPEYTVDPETGLILEEGDIDPDDISDLSLNEQMALSCPTSLFEMDCLGFNEPQDEEEALEVERLLDLGLLKSEPIEPEVADDVPGETCQDNTL